MVEILDKSNAPLQEIYDTVCSVVPAMADEDMYFLDKLLGTAHVSGTAIGECVVCDVRLCLGRDSDDWDGEDGNLVPFSMVWLTQLQGSTCLWLCRMMGISWKDVYAR